MIECWIRLWPELVSARSARVGCAGVPVQWPVLVLVLLRVQVQVQGSVQPWVTALESVLVVLALGAQPLLVALRSGLS